MQSNDISTQEPSNSPESGASLSSSEVTTNQSNQPSRTGRSNRGFASMDPKRQREIASEGGRAAHEKGTAHEFTSEEARAAGRKGGQARSRSARSRSESSNSGSSESGR
ncbi:MAG: KGG domain-containing protein [Pseudomonadota bacterium]|jgi:general stress protein YciG